MKEKIMFLILVLLFVVSSVASFDLGIRAGQNIMTHEYRLMLDNQDAEIILETVDEIVSRQEVK